MIVEERSFENKVWFYKDQLIAIMKGRRATKVLVSSERRGMVEYGILTRGRGPSTHKVTPKAQVTLRRAIE